MKKQFESPVIFEKLLEETRESDSEFVVKTADSIPPSFADELINTHYPPQTELPLS